MSTDAVSVARLCVVTVHKLTLLMVRAGDHCDLRISRQMEPFELMLG